MPPDDAHKAHDALDARETPRSDAGDDTTSQVADQRPLPDSVATAAPERAALRVGASVSATAPSDPSAPAVTTADRVERIDDLHDALRSRPLSSLTLRVEDETGTDHRIRVDLRGQQIAAEIALPEGARLAALAERLPDLSRQLGEHGFEPAALHVRALPTAGEALPSESRGREQERHGQQQGQHEQHHHHQSRHRARREQEGDT